MFMALFWGIWSSNLISPTFAILGIIGAYTIFTLFAFITLPVEYDATKRALAWVDQRNITNGDEHAMAKDASKCCSKHLFGGCS